MHVLCSYIQLTNYPIIFLQITFSCIIILLATFQFWILAIKNSSYVSMYVYVATCRLCIYKLKSIMYKELRIMLELVQKLIVKVNSYQFYQLCTKYYGYYSRFKVKFEHNFRNNTQVIKKNYWKVLQLYLPMYNITLAKLRSTYTAVCGFYTSSYIASSFVNSLNNYVSIHYTIQGECICMVLWGKPQM